MTRMILYLAQCSSHVNVTWGAAMHQRNMKIKL